MRIIPAAANAGQRSQPARHQRRIRHRVAVFMASTVIALGAMTAMSATPASAAITLTNTYCSGGNGAGGGVVSSYVGISADREILNGGQYVSIRYYMIGPDGKTRDFGYQTPFWAPRWGTQMSHLELRPGWYGWARVYVNVAYFDGQRWSYQTDWTRVDVRANYQSCWF